MKWWHVVSGSSMFVFEVGSFISTILNDTVQILSWLCLRMDLWKLWSLFAGLMKKHSLCHYMTWIDSKERKLEKYDKVVGVHGFFAEFVPWEIWDWSRFGAWGVNQIIPSSIEWAMIGIWGTSWRPMFQLIDTWALCDIFQGSPLHCLTSQAAMAVWSFC